MTEISKTLERFINPQPIGVKELTPICENILRFFLWSLTFIPFLNTWLDKECEKLFEKENGEPFKADDLTQFRPYAFPPYYPSKLVERFKGKINQSYCERVRRYREAPDFSLCYAELSLLSNDETCKTALKESVQEFCKAISKDSGHLLMGRPNQTHPLPLSSDFLDACSEILPTHFKKINALHINGPIKKNTDQHKLQAIIEKMENLKTIYLCPEFFECSEKSSNFFKQIQAVHVTPANIDDQNATSSPIILEKGEGTSTLKIPSNLLNACRKALPNCFKNLQDLHIESMHSEKESSHLKSTVLPEYLSGIEQIDAKPAPPQKEGSDETGDTDLRSDSINVHLPSNFFESPSKLSVDLL